MLKSAHKYRKSFDYELSFRSVSTCGWSDDCSSSPEKGEIKSEDVILIDFDRAHYGFRMWDILYFLTNYQLNFVPDHDELAEIFEGYFYVLFWPMV